MTPPDELSLFAEPEHTVEFPPDVLAASKVIAGVRALILADDDQEILDVYVLGWPDLAVAEQVVREADPHTVGVIEEHGDGVIHLRQVHAVYTPDPEVWLIRWRDVLPTAEGAFPVTVWEVPRT